MAEDKKEIDIQKAAVPSPSVRMGEMSSTGLKVAGGVVFEEEQPALQWPENKRTFDKMSHDATISSANNTIKAFVRKTKYNVSVEATVPSAEQEAQIQLIRECMGDMDHTFSDFMNEAFSFLTYGYSLHEKVFKFRNQKGKYKSRYNDGRIGWAKLPVRSQDSISRWYYDDKGRDLVTVEQDLGLTASQYNPNQGYNGFKNQRIEIPRNKLLHIRHDVTRNNPEGKSPLISCFIPWRYKAKIEEYQAIGVSRDLGGLPVIYLPPEYMSPDASPDKVAVYEYYKEVVRNLHANQQAGLVMPRYIDPESKMDMFSFELISVSGGKMYDTIKIIGFYENKILMTYLADVLKLGQEASGSFALSDNKTNLLAVGIKSLIDEVLQEFNCDLIPQTLLMNGFDITEDTPKITIEDLDDRDLDILSKMIQRAVSVGALEVDENLSDWIREEIGAPSVNRDNPIKPDMIGGGDTRAGDGMATGGDGTSKSPSGGDSSTSNSENK